MIAQRIKNNNSAVPEGAQTMLEKKPLASRRNIKMWGIGTAASIAGMEENGYLVLDLEEEGSEELKSKAPSLYAKIYQQGQEDGRTQARRSAEISAKAKVNDAKKLEEEKTPKTPKTLKEKWDAGPELRAEFGGNFDTCESYFMNDEEFKATGNVSRSNPKDATLPPKPTATETAKEIWDRDPKLRTEFSDNFVAYEAYVKDAKIY